MQHVITLSTGKVKSGFKGEIIEDSFTSRKVFVGEECVPVIVVDCDVKIEGHVWKSLQIGKDIDFIN